MVDKVAADLFSSLWTDHTRRYTDLVDRLSTKTDLINRLSTTTLRDGKSCITPTALLHTFVFAFNLGSPAQRRTQWRNIHALQGMLASGSSGFPTRVRIQNVCFYNVPAGCKFLPSTDIINVKEESSAMWADGHIADQTPWKDVQTLILAGGSFAGALLEDMITRTQSTSATSIASVFAKIWRV